MRRSPQKPEPFQRAADPRLAAVMEYGRRQTRTYQGNWTAPWLLTDIETPVWQVRTPATRYVQGEWRGAFPFHWDYPLPDGTTLLDSRHDNLRRLLHRVTFVVRENPAFGIAAAVTHRSFFFNNRAVVQWMFLHEDIYEPDREFFRRIDGQAINDFMTSIKQGGVAWALKLPQRTLSAFYMGAKGRQPNWARLSNTLIVPERDRQDIVGWLHENDLYATAKHGWGGSEVTFVDRVKLAALLSIDHETLRSSPKYSAFLRQFEPELLKINSHLLIPARGVRGTEHPLHTTPLLAEALREIYNNRSIRGYLYHWETVLRLHKEFPDQIPDLTAQELRTLTPFRRIDKGDHTPWIPMKTALAYTREALRWTAEYQEPLVDFYLRAVRVFKRRKWFSYQPDSIGHDVKLAERRDQWVRENVPPELKALNISGWTSWYSKKDENAFELVRERPGLNDAMQVLVGAVIVLIGVLKPIRESELTHLKRNCVRFQKKDGYWLAQSLRKTGVEGQLQQIERPIPYIVGSAIRHLGRLGDEVGELLGEKDGYAFESLFYLPQFVRSASLKAKLSAPTDISRFLNRFCDYVDLPVDEHGRRWYVRIHEMRKSFLITLFWCFRFASLDAARWIAGHSTVEEIYEYIEANFPGEELPHLCAEYATQQLWNFNKGRRTETDNVAELYRNVCKHFRVSEINLVPETDLVDWLEVAFKEGIYDIEPYTISASGVTTVQIAFRIARREEHA
jgi:hypothetical protein